MPALRLLEAEFRDLDRRLNHDRYDAEDMLEALARRFDQVLAEIYRIPPEDLADCRIKIARLADPSHGIEAGHRPGVIIALRQVAQFLGQFG
jgi:hypothetical protein